MSKTVLLTGCSSGIGYYCAHALRDAGYRVLATCRAPEDVTKLENEGFEAFVLDLRNPKSIHDGALWAKSVSEGKIDVLFNNGAYGQPGAVEDISEDVLKEQFETNVFGTQALSNAIIPLMRKQGRGRIIYNSSVLGFASMAYRGAYNASKYAIEGLCDTMRLELKGSGIDIVLIEPGPIRSEFRKTALKKFTENIDLQQSAHKEVYEKTLERLSGDGDAPFTLGPDAVYKALIKAIEAKKPKARYRVTLPTKLFWYLKRILPTSLLDKILERAG